MQRADSDRLWLLDFDFCVYCLIVGEHPVSESHQADEHLVISVESDLVAIDEGVW